MVHLTGLFKNYMKFDKKPTPCHSSGNFLIDWLIDFIYIRGKPEKAAMAYLAEYFWKPAHAAQM